VSSLGHVSRTPVLIQNEFLLTLYICKDLPSKLGHIPRFQEDINWGETSNAASKTLDGHAKSLSRRQQQS
jgi:hypothetical protein